MIDSKYNHNKVEEGKYKWWKEKGLFEPSDKRKEPFSIVIPPPNVTGKLHLGHAWDTSLQDIIIRYKKMDGYDAVWFPGMDHAGIATQAKVDAKLKDIGYKPREMDRNEWLNHAWSWKDEYALNIHEQWEKLGLSLAYSKERFTLDEGLNKSVRYVFVTLYNKGYIYRGEGIINWDPEAMTALSNEEVIYKEEKGSFYHIKYMLEDGSGYLEVATTRPETLFGDTAVAVNPNDERYRKYIGNNVVLPIVNKLIPIVADNHADMEKGTGVVKITPAHDPNDFEVGKRHNLERIIVMNPDATMNSNALKYEGLDRFDCRKQLLKDLKDEDLLIKTEEITHTVGYSERTDVVIEPYLSKQWFVDMSTLSKQVIDNQLTSDKVNFIPERFEKILNHWMENCYDWCISRQLWWGHRIPAWYKGEEIYVGEVAPDEEGWTQDPDVLDTWFSSALWPFSILGWPEETEDFKRYFPNNVLVTGYDIIFFWVCRMIFQSLEFNKIRPFDKVLIHGLIRDSKGRKMSKSLGNGVDPMDVIAEYGTDSLRFFLTTSSAPGADLRYDEEKVKSTWNFINKLWNASRFVSMTIGDYKTTGNLENLNISDKWILSKLNNTIKIVRKHMDKYEFNVVGAELYDFFWNDFCDWYIELSKVEPSNDTKETLEFVLMNILKMLHPFMPYVTEEIYGMFKTGDESILETAYPSVNNELYFKESKNMEIIIDFISKVRRIKTENNIGKDYIIIQNSNLFEENKEVIAKMLKINKDDILNTSNRDDLDSFEITFGDEIVTLYYDGKENKEKELENLKREKNRLEESISRRGKLLSNTGYVSNAPESVVESERKNLEQEKRELELIIDKLK